MKAYWFKAAIPDGAQWRGLVVGQTMEDIFWAIDDFIDPSRVLVQPARSGGMCAKYDEQGGAHSSPELNEDTDETKWEPLDMSWKK